MRCTLERYDSLPVVSMTPPIALASTEKGEGQKAYSNISISLPRTTSSAHTSSMSTLRSRSSFSPVLAG